MELYIERFTFGDPLLDKRKMTVNFNNKIIDGWWTLLRHLSRDARLELASRLINSLKTPEPDKSEEGWIKLYGSWADSNESAEELIALIKDSRNVDRKIEPFD